MDTTDRTRWRYFAINTEVAQGISCLIELEPDMAISRARARMRTPAFPDEITCPDALSRLIAGETLRAYCVDGTKISIVPQDR